MNKFLLSLGIILLAIGVKLIYDARPIVKMYFSFGEENEAVMRHENSRIYYFHHRSVFYYILIFK